MKLFSCVKCPHRFDPLLTFCLLFLGGLPETVRSDARRSRLHSSLLVESSRGPGTAERGTFKHVHVLYVCMCQCNILHRFPIGIRMKITAGGNAGSVEWLV